MTDLVLATDRLEDDEHRFQYEISTDDVRATSQLNPNGRGAVIRLMLTHFGLPLLPSVLILLMAQLWTAATALVVVFFLLVLAGAWRPKMPGWSEGDKIDVIIRRNHVHISSAQGCVRRGWLWFDRATLKRSWLCLHRRKDVLIAIPRRIMDANGQGEALVDKLNLWIQSEDTQPMIPLDAGEMDFSDSFVYTSDEIDELMKGHLAIVNEDGQEQSARTGCFLILVLLMVVAGGLVSQLPGSAPHRMLVWVAVCAAIWAPLVMWRLLEPLRLRYDRDSIEQAIKINRRHGIGPAGVMDTTETAQELWNWESVTRVNDNEAFVFVHGALGQFFATPKRALPAPSATLAAATAFWKSAHPEDPSAAFKEEKPGPATESGNPYQPPPE